MNQRTAACILWFVAFLRLGLLVDILVDFDNDDVTKILSLTVAAHTAQTLMISMHVFTDESAVLARSFMWFESFVNLAGYAPGLYLIYDWEYAAVPGVIGCALWFVRNRIAGSFATFPPAEYSVEYYSFPTTTTVESAQ